MITKIRYVLLEWEYFFRMNFGHDEWGWQVLWFHLIKNDRNVSSQTIKRHYETDLVTKIGDYYFVIA